MDIGVISIRYARALLKSATDAKLEDTVYQDMMTVAKSYVDVPALRQTIDNPMLSKDKKESLLTIERDIRMGDELHHRLAIFFQHKADERLGQVGRLFATGCEQQRLLLVLRKHRIVDGLTQRRHVGVAFRQCHHLVIDLRFQLRSLRTFQQRPCISRRNNS